MDNNFGGTIDNEEKRDELSELFLKSDPLNFDNPESELETPILKINLDELDEETKKKAKLITERLANYYFDPKYIQNHPYIPSKIATEFDDVRRLLKMLSVNEKAQDTLIIAISMNTSKSTIYQSLTSLQNTMLSIQQQLNTRVSQLESIFQQMQTNTEETFEEKNKEESEDGSMVVRGSRDFIKKIEAMANGENLTKEEQNKEDIEEV